MIVVKVGGSLYDLPDLQSRLLNFLATLPERDVLLVPGGGPTADVVRDFDRLHRLGPVISHDLALRACSLNAHFLAALTGAGVVAWPGNAGLAVLDSYAFAQTDGTLPASWYATSDSVAARAAAVVTGELVLLKSVTIPADMPWYEVARLGHVDPIFPGIVARFELRVRAVNLRG